MLFESSNQLDIFNDSRDVMLRNDVLKALQGHDATQAQGACDALERDYPADVKLNASEKVATHAGAESISAWFSAWLLISRSDLAEALTMAQAGQHSAPEQAMRLLLNLLTLERQGRHHDLIQQRKALRDLHPGLFAAYMKTR